MPRRTRAAGRTASALAALLLMCAPAAGRAAPAAAKAAYSNEFTSRDETAYYEEGGKESLDTMLQLDSDRMRELSLLPDLMKSEVEVVREERRYRTDNSVPGMLDEALYCTAFEASP